MAPIDPQCGSAYYAAMHSFFELSAGAKILLAVCAAVLIAEGAYINYVMGGAVMSVFSSATSCERVLEKWKDANPETAKNRPLYQGAIAAVDFENTNLSQAREFKMAIEEGVAGGPNFAGKYAVAQWGCGTQCQNHAIVNVESGKIIALGPQSEAGVGVTPESNILVVNPQENFPPPAEMQKASLETLLSLVNLAREYYVLEGEGDMARLQKLCTENSFEGMGI